MGNERDLAIASLRATLTHFAGEPPEVLWEEFRGFMRLRTMKKGEAFAREGEHTHSVAFVASGLFRMFYRRPDGRELNKSFVAENDFVGSFEALLSGDVNRLAIECMAPATVLEFTFAKARALHDRHHYWQRFGRLLAERLYVKKARREAALLMDTALERYEVFLQEHPELAERVPDYHIASYLGITPEALSRLKKARVRS